jgi:hypothetical protein
MYKRVVKGGFTTWTMFLNQRLVKFYSEFDRLEMIKFDGSTKQQSFNRSKTFIRIQPLSLLILPTTKSNKMSTLTSCSSSLRARHPALLPA